MGRRSWFAVEGSLEPINFHGLSFFRFPEAVAEHVIERYSAPGDWVIDPFCGFGTTLVVAERLGRHAVGCEVDERRAAFSASRLSHPHRVVHGSCEVLKPARWPPFALLFTSPPYGSFRPGDHAGDPATYLADARRLFSGLARLLGPGATVAVELSQLRQGDRTHPLVWQLGAVLNEIFTLREEIVRVNTGETPAGPGYDHDHILVFDVPLPRHNVLRIGCAGRPRYRVDGPLYRLLRVGCPATWFRATPGRIIPGRREPGRNCGAQCPHARAGR